MALINCPKCGKEISDKARRCPGCGYILTGGISTDYVEKDVPEDHIKSPIIFGASALEAETKKRVHIDCNEQNFEDAPKTNAQVDSAPKYDARESARVNLKIFTMIFIICAVFFFGKAFYVKNAYDNSDYSWGAHTNAYVGGDAYNYIINGTYFIGYCVIGMGCAICATITGSNYLKYSISKEKDEKEDGTD